MPIAEKIKNGNIAEVQALVKALYAQSEGNPEARAAVEKTFGPHFAARFAHEQQARADMPKKGPEKAPESPEAKKPGQGQGQPSNAPTSGKISQKKPKKHDELER